MLEVPANIRMLTPAGIYIVCKPFKTLGTQQAGLEAYKRGDHITLIEQTLLDPFEHGCSPNWVVECKHWKPPQDESVWTCIESFIRDGFIVLTGLSEHVAS